MKNIKFKKRKRIPSYVIAAICVVVTAVIVAGIFVAVRLAKDGGNKNDAVGYTFSTEGFENISDIRSLNEEMAVFTDYASGKKGLMSLDGKITEEAEHNEFSVVSDTWRNYRYIADSPRSEYLLLVDKETKTVTSRQYHGLMSPELIPCWHEEVKHLAWTDEIGYAGEVKTSEVSLAPGLYPVANSLKEGAKYGYVSHILRLDIALLYENALDFSDGLAAVRKAGKWGYINESGVTVIPCGFDSCSMVDAMKKDCAFSFRNGLAPVCKDGKFGIINKKAETVVDFSFDRIIQGSGGVYLALKDGSWGLITIKKEMMPVETTTAAETAAESGEVVARGSYTVKTAGSVLNMRKEAYAQSDIVAKIPNGAVISVSKSVPGWAYAKYNSFSGWVSAKFLVPVTETAVSQTQTGVSTTAG
ncbi:MAG: WG repeat-containing protein [Clostridia bacterium]|nr:WG repeat-containing protein [Clostridia bacterium]